jgi:hypothetical protein
MGILELLVLVLILGFPALIIVLVRGGWLKRALMRLIEGRAYREGIASSGRRVLDRSRRLLFPEALAIVLLTSAPAVYLYATAITSHEPLIAADTRWTYAAFRSVPVSLMLLWQLRIVPGFALLGALYLHFRPGHDRRAKYMWLLCWASASAWVSLDGYLDLLASSQLLSSDSWSVSYRHSIPRSALIVLVLLNPAFALAIADVASSWWRRRIDDRGAVRWHRWLRNGAIPVLFVFSPHPILLIYLLLRYHVNETLAEQPIVYLRSFHHTHGPNAFGRIVVKAASRFGVIAAIVHRSQRGSVLMSLANVLDHARVERVADDRWQDWVVQRLKSATAVVIDVTITSPSVTWELTTALAHVGPERIVLMAEEGATFPAGTGVARIEYALERRSLKAARRSLEAWFAAADLSPSAVGPHFSADRELYGSPGPG